MRGGGGAGRPLTKIFFPVWTCIKPNLVSKIFPFTGGGGCPRQNYFFFRSEHVSSQIWCQNFFPLLGGGRGVPRQKFFFPVWTCIKPNLVSKNFPFTETGYPPPRTDTHLWKHNLPSYVRTRAVKIIPIEYYWSFRSNDTIYAKQNGGKYDFVISGAFSLPTQVQFWDYLFVTGKQ